MMTLTKIAIRNLLKNSRRSFFTMLAIGLGFAAVTMFGGFTSYMFSGLQDAFIYGQANGHLTILKEGFLSRTHDDPEKYLLSAEESAKVNKILQGFSEVVFQMPQLQISGLLSNGDVSTIFVASGRQPSIVRKIRGSAPGIIGNIKLFQGNELQDDVPYGVGVSNGLARLLNLELNGNAITMMTTAEGQINALDVEVFQLIDAPIELLNDKLMFVPLDFAQSLFDTKGVDRISVLLQKTDQTELLLKLITEELIQQGLPVEVKTWKELAPSYGKVKDMFNMIFIFIFVIVFVIVVMSVINTIGMAIMERTREIGTLRTLGVKRSGIVLLFTAESGLLGLFGSGLGFFISVVSWLIVRFLEPTWIPPGITRSVPIEVNLIPGYMLLSLVFLVTLSLLSAIMPAWRAAKRGIVEALAHV